MKRSSHLRHRPRLDEKQRGYVLIGVVLAFTLMLIALAYQAPRIAQQIQRDREEELVRRGKEYARAIRRYYRKFGRYPASIEQLENTNNLRFLRRKYTDPITGKAEWRIIRFGEAKTQPRLFGVAGGATAAQPGVPASALAGQQGQPGGAAATPAQAGTPASQISRPLGTGATMGGGAMVGVSSTSDKESIKEWNGKTRYNEWEFVYDPRFDASMQQQGGVPGARPGDTRQLPPGSRPTPGGPTGLQPTPTGPPDRE